MNAVKSRKTAMNAALHCCYNLGMSMASFEECVDMCAFSDENINDALWQLKSRGELEHLIQWVWTFRK